MFCKRQGKRYDKKLYNLFQMEKNAQGFAKIKRYELEIARD